LISFQLHVESKLYVPANSLYENQNRKQ